VLRCGQDAPAVDSDAALLEAHGAQPRRELRALHFAGRHSSSARRRHGAQVSAVVVDTGAGIAPEHCEKIFEEFYQVRRGGGSAVTPAGMGLGLAIVRRLAQLLGHDVAVVSRLGTGFHVSHRHAEGGPTPRTRSSARCLAPRASVAFRSTGRSWRWWMTTPRPIDAMSELFSIWGAQVVGGRDARSLLDVLCQSARYPDLVVADLRLGDGASGVTTVRALRAELGFAVPALIVSGDTSAAAERAARSAGLTLLPKPVVANVLEAVATALVARAVPRGVTAHAL
jgi:CheY-like chemotaxis protein